MRSSFNDLKRSRASIRLSSRSKAFGLSPAGRCGAEILPDRCPVKIPRLELENVPTLPAGENRHRSPERLGKRLSSGYTDSRITICPESNAGWITLLVCSARSRKKNFSSSMGLWRSDAADCRIRWPHIRLVGSFEIVNGSPARWSADARSAAWVVFPAPSMPSNAIRTPVSLVDGHSGSLLP